MPKLAEYYRPATLEEALSLLKREQTVPIAGGAHIVPRLGHNVRAVVDLQMLGLDGFGVEGDLLRMGATMPLQRLVTSAEAGGFLAEAARLEGPQSYRNGTTLGGLVATAAPLSEVLMALLVLDAEVHLRLPDPAEVSLSRMLEDPKKMLDGGLIVEVTALAPHAASGVSMERVARTPKDKPIISVAARVKRSGDVCEDVAIAVVGVAEHPVRLPDVEGALKGETMHDRFIEKVVGMVKEGINPPSDFRAGGEYRREMAGVLVRRVLKRLCGRVA